MEYKLKLALSFRKLHLLTKGVLQEYNLFNPIPPGGARVESARADFNFRELP